MGKKFYTIIVKGGINDYTLGKITGAINALSGGEKIEEDPLRIGKAIKLKTTKRKYRNLQKFMESHYPGKCIFYDDDGWMVIKKES